MLETRDFFICTPRYTEHLGTFVTEVLNLGTKTETENISN